MPSRRPPAPTPAPALARKSRGDPAFRHRYEAIEKRRDDLLARLSRFDQKARDAGPYKNARKLLDAAFRAAPLAKRLQVLQAAEWLIDLLEILPM